MVKRPEGTAKSLKTEKWSLGKLFEDLGSTSLKPTNCSFQPPPAFLDFAYGFLQGIFYLLYIPLE